LKYELLTFSLLTFFEEGVIFISLVLLEVSTIFIVGLSGCLGVIVVGLPELPQK